MRKIGIQPFRSYSSSTKMESNRSFVRFICLLLLFAGVVISSQKSNSQTRPRRVGDRGTSEGSTPSSTSTSPSQPPVLRGANSNGQSPGTQSRQPAANGPEEVGAGDNKNVGRFRMYPGHERSLGHGCPIRVAHEGRDRISKED
jgi:hypothetical protein